MVFVVNKGPCGACSCTRPSCICVMCMQVCAHVCACAFVCVWACVLVGYWQLMLVNGDGNDQVSQDQKV